MAKQRIWLLVAAALLLALLAFNFLNFRAAASNTQMNRTLGVYHAGDTLPDNMAPGFTLSFTVSGEDPLAAALSDALQAQLEQLPAIGTATPVSTEDARGDAPLLVVELAPQRLWTPFYARATVQAQLFYADDGDAPWPLDEPVVFDDPPAVKANGELTLVDTTWGLISKPAYSQHLAQELAGEITGALQEQVFTVP